MPRSPSKADAAALDARGLCVSFDNCHGSDGESYILARLADKETGRQVHAARGHSRESALASALASAPDGPPDVTSELEATRARADALEREIDALRRKNAK